MNSLGSATAAHNVLARSTGRATSLARWMAGSLPAGAVPALLVGWLGFPVLFHGHPWFQAEFGITGGRPFAGDAVDLLFEVEFVKK